MDQRVKALKKPTDTAKEKRHALQSKQQQVTTLQKQEKSSLESNKLTSSPQRNLPKRHRINKNSNKEHDHPNNSSSTKENKSLTKSLDSQSGLKTNSQGAPENVSGVKCLSLEDYFERAQAIKADIKKSLESSASNKIIDTPSEILKLKEDILELSSDVSQKIDESKSDQPMQPSKKSQFSDSDVLVGEGASTVASPKTDGIEPSQENNSSGAEINISQAIRNPSSTKDLGVSIEDRDKQCCSTPCQVDGSEESTMNLISTEGKALNEDENEHNPQDKIDADVICNSHVSSSSEYDETKFCNDPHDNKRPSNADTSLSNEFELLEARLDPESKHIAIMASLQKQLNIDSPDVLEPICRKLISLSEQNSFLKTTNKSFEIESEKMQLVKQKLESLCRELQRSNNALRIESLDLIKLEQSKAKEQTTKIQSTLSGVIRLFDENQQRNMALRQENQELQNKLRALLEHCSNWETSVEAALRQRDIENRLIKTELAKANLLKNEEKEKFLKEKQDLLRLLSTMKEQQQRIEGSEARLRSDLSSYASKYNECQQVITDGMNKFHAESNRMMKQIAKSREDYRSLLTKYENSNKKMVQLLNERHHFEKALKLSNKKVDTLEKLCRAMRATNRDSRSNTNEDNKTIIKLNEGLRGIEKEVELVETPLASPEQCENSTIDSKTIAISTTTKPTIYDSADKSFLDDHVNSRTITRDHLSHDTKVDQNDQLDEKSSQSETEKTQELSVDHQGASPDNKKLIK